MKRALPAAPPAVVDAVVKCPGVPRSIAFAWWIEAGSISPSRRDGLVFVVAAAFGMVGDRFGEA